MHSHHNISNLEEDYLLFGTNESGTSSSFLSPQFEDSQVSFLPSPSRSSDHKAGDEDYYGALVDLEEFGDSHDQYWPVEDKSHHLQLTEMASIPAHVQAKIDRSYQKSGYGPAISPFGDRKDDDVKEAQLTRDIFERCSEETASTLPPWDVFYGLLLGKCIFQKYIRTQMVQASEIFDTNGDTDAGGNRKRQRNATKEQPSKRQLTTNNARLRRRRGHSPEDENNEGEDETTTGKIAKGSRSLACPYYVAHPRHCSRQNTAKPEFRNCGTCVLWGRNELTQHLHRVHLQPPNYCGLCYEIFPTRQDERDHSAQQTCQRRQNPFIPGKMPQEQWPRIIELSSTTNEEYWLQVFAILFPTSPQPTSIYSDEWDLEQQSVLLHLFRCLGPDTARALYQILRDASRPIPMPSAHRGILELAWETFAEEDRQARIRPPGFTNLEPVQDLVTREIAAYISLQPPVPTGLERIPLSQSTTAYGSQDLHLYQQSFPNTQHSASFGNSMNTMNGSNLNTMNRMASTGIGPTNFMNDNAGQSSLITRFAGYQLPSPEINPQADFDQECAAMVDRGFEAIRQRRDADRHGSNLQ